MSNLATIVNNILADSGIDDINVVVTNGSYSNPAWITALSWSKITSTPTTLSGYGITDAVPANRTITINGVTQDLSANRSWTITAGVSSVSAGTGISVNQTTGAVIVTNTGTLTVAGTTNQVLVNGGTAAANGNITLSLPQSIGISNTPTFGGLIVSGSETRQINLVLPASYNGTGYGNLIERINFPWYSEYWDIGVRRGGGVDIQSMEFWLNGTTKMFEITKTSGLAYLGGNTILTSANYTSYAVPTSGYEFGTVFSLGTMYASTGIQGTNLDYMIGVYTNGYVYRFTSGAVASWVGLGNYLPLTGGTVTGPVYMTGGSSTTPNLTVDRNIASPSNYYTGLQLEVRATSGTAGIGLHRNGFSHVGIYHDSSNELKFNMNAGTPVLGAGVGTIIGSGNYNSYAPTLTGGGASGTWGINVTGSAGYTQTLALTGLGNGTVNVNNPNTAVYRNENGLGAAVAYAPLLHLGGGDTMWQIQGTYGSSGSGVLYFRQGYNGSWGTWLTMLSSSNYNNYSPTLTGGGASGTWGINVTGTAASETLATVVARGNSTGGGRPIVLDNGGGAIITTASAGGWAMGTYYKGSGGTTLAGFGAYGGNDSLTYAWIGSAYNTAWMTIDSGTATFNTATTINGRLLLNTGGGNTYGIVSGYPNNNHLMTLRGQITGSTASPTVTGAHQMTFVEYAGADDTSGWYFKSSSTGTYEEVARITRTGINWNGNTVLHSGNYNSYAPTLTGGNASGTWGINISGNAATATTSTSSNYSNYLVSNSASVNNGFASWNSYDDTTNNPGNSWWYGMRVSHGDAVTYYSFSIGANFFTNEVYYRRISGGTSQGWVKFLDSGNYNSYAPTLSGTGASGTWGINISGTAQYFANNYIGQADANTIWRAGSYTFFNGVNVPASDFGLISFPTWSSTDSNSRYNIQLGANIGGNLRYRSTNINGAGSWATMLSDANYNSYSPTLTGGGASGTWGISITGNADTVDGYHASTSTIGNYIVVRDGNGYIFGNYINMTDDGNPGGGTSISSFITKQGDNYYRSVSPTNAMASIRGVASGSWGINISGSASSSTTAAYLPTLYAGGVQSNPQVYFGQSVGLRVAMTGVPFAWCDTLWINGYSGGDVLPMCALHTARNTQPRMWISAQNSNGSSYGTTYEFVTGWNSPYALNMNQYVRTTDAVSFASTNSTTFYNGRYTEWWCGDAVAPGPGANRYEVGRIGIDYNDWNGVGTFEVELQEIYYYAGGRKRYVISYGYGGPVISCSLVELNGVAAQGNFRVVVGSEVVVSGDWRYLPVYVEVQYYTQVAIKVRTTRNITNSNVPEVGYAKVFTSPSGTGIGGFIVDTTVYPTSGQADISNPILRATSNLVTPTIYSGGGNVTFGNNIGLDGSNAQIQFNAAASSDLYLSCIPGTRTMQIRNGNSGSPNYSACGLVTGTVDLTYYLQLSSDRVTQSNGHVGYFVSTQYSSTNYIPFSFESQYGTHSWGGVARFHIQQSGVDRPSITFSSGSSNDRWSVGFCTGSDDNFRITQNMGMRPDGSGNNDGWGTQRMLINTSGNTTFSGTVTATAFFESSDRRIKDLIQDNYRVNDIETIRPKLYKKNGKIELGYYAQDVESIFSHAISVNDDGFLNLSYREVHTAKIAYLEDSIEEIKAKILYLENQLKTKQ